MVFYINLYFYTTYLFALFHQENCSSKPYERHNLMKLYPRYAIEDRTQGIYHEAKAINSLIHFARS